MDKENIVHIHNGIIFSCKEKTNYEIGVARNNHSEWDNPDWGRELPSMFMLALNL